MKTKLSPFVYQVKGKKNYLFFDSLKGEIFNISPEGDPYELESQLIKLGLVFETEGVVPIKFKPNIENVLGACKFVNFVIEYSHETSTNYLSRCLSPHNESRF